MKHNLFIYLHIYLLIDSNILLLKQLHSGFNKGLVSEEVMESIYW